MGKETLTYRAARHGEDYKLLLVIEGCSDAKYPPFSKSSLHLVQFDGKFIGVCKTFAVGLTTEKFTILLLISCVLLSVRRG